MQSAEHTAFWAKWSREMADDNAPGGKIDRGPVETLTSRPGRQAPKRNKARSRVPDPRAGQVRKGGPPS